MGEEEDKKSWSGGVAPGGTPLRVVLDPCLYLLSLTLAMHVESTIGPG